MRDSHRGYVQEMASAAERRRLINAAAEDAVAQGGRIVSLRETEAVIAYQRSRWIPAFFQGREFHEVIRVSEDGNLRVERV